MVPILVMSAKMATLGPSKREVFWDKCYDVIMFFDDVISKIW